MPLTYTVIGTGKLGGVLANALYKIGWQPASLYNRSPEKATALSESLGDRSHTGTWPRQNDDLGTYIFLCVPDDAIAETVQKLTQDFDLSGKKLIHTSGSLPASVLDPAKKGGAETAAFHPLQTFSGAAGGEVFRNVSISLQGDEGVIAELKTLAHALQARPVVISEADKQRLHIAAVFASNYLVTLMDLAEQSVEDPELKEQLPELFNPLINQTVRNLKEKGPQQSLTGPLSRGDKATVAHHLELLKQNPDLAESYRFLADRTLSLIERAGTVEKTVIEQIRDLIGGSGPKESE